MRFRSIPRTNCSKSCSTAKIMPKKHSPSSSNISVAVKCFWICQSDWQGNESVRCKPFYGRNCEICWYSFLFDYQHLVSPKHSIQTHFVSCDADICKDLRPQCDVFGHLSSQQLPECDRCNRHGLSRARRYIEVELLSSSTSQRKWHGRNRNIIDYFQRLNVGEVREEGRSEGMKDALSGLVRQLTKVSLLTHLS